MKNYQYTGGSSPCFGARSLAMTFLADSLSPGTRLGEILFGLIMTLTFTLGAGAYFGGRSERATTELLYATIGCNIAWGIIDAALIAVQHQSSTAADWRGWAQPSPRARTTTPRSPSWPASWTKRWCRSRQPISATALYQQRRHAGAHHGTEASLTDARPTSPPLSPYSATCSRRVFRPRCRSC